MANAKIGSAIQHHKTGRWTLVGWHLPVSACFERKDGAPLTANDIEAILHCGPGFAPDCRTKTYATKEEALGMLVR